MYHINGKKNKNYRTILADEEKALDKVKHTFMIKIFNKLETGGNLFNLIKDIQEGGISSIVFTEE